MSGKRSMFQIVLAASLLLPHVVCAQPPEIRTPRRAFGGPPVFELFRQQTGILPNFYQFYRPRQQLQRTLQMQDNQLRRQGIALQSLQNQAWGPQQSATLGPTGTRSGFMNYSHFYPGISGQGR